MHQQRSDHGRCQQCGECTGRQSPDTLGSRPTMGRCTQGQEEGPAQGPRMKPESGAPRLGPQPGPEVEAPLSPQVGLEPELAALPKAGLEQQLMLELEQHLGLVVSATSHNRRCRDGQRSALA